MRRKEPERYLANAREILKKSLVEGNYYLDAKYVRTAFGCVYLGILSALDDFLMSRGVSRDKLPKKVDEYLKALKKYGGPYNGKLMRQFDALYDEVHVGGYYRGILRSVKAVQSIFNDAEQFIKRISK